MSRHVGESRVEKLVKRVAFQTVVLNRQPVRRFEGNPVGRVGQNQISGFAVHQTVDVFSGSRVAAQQAVPTDCPKISLFDKGGFFECGSQIKIVVLRIAGGRVGQELFQIVVVKSEQRQIESVVLQIGKLDAEHLFVPSSIECQLIVREDIGPFLRVGQILGEDAGNCRVSFFTGSGDSAVADEDIVLAVDHSGGDKAELPE